MNDGYGAQLLKNPEIIKDCVRQLHNHLPSNKTISVKLRLLDDHRQVLKYKTPFFYMPTAHKRCLEHSPFNLLQSAGNTFFNTNLFIS